MHKNNIKQFNIKVNAIFEMRAYTKEEAIDEILLQLESIVELNHGDDCGNYHSPFTGKPPYIMKVNSTKITNPVIKG